MKATRIRLRSTRATPTASTIRLKPSTALVVTTEVAACSTDETDSSSADARDEVVAAVAQSKLIVSAWISELLELRRMGRTVPGWCDSGAMSPFSDAD